MQSASFPVQFDTLLQHFRLILVAIFAFFQSVSAKFANFCASSFGRKQKPQ